MTIRFLRTRDPHGYMSNFAPYGLEAFGLWWRSNEHFYQAMKFKGTELAEKIRGLKTARDAADWGRSVDFPCRSDWEGVKESVMRFGVANKFRQNGGISRQLVATAGEHLIEASYKDPYWGWGPNQDGQNRLGVILMEVRDKLIETQGQPDALARYIEEQVF